MLPFNVGEFTTRLRIALGVRGRMPINLDEHVIPSVQLQNLDGPPWRREGVRYSAALMNSTAIAGEFAGVYCQFNPVPAGGVFVIDSVTMSDTSFVTASGLLLNGTAVMRFFPAPGAILTGGITLKMVASERYPGSPSIAAYAAQLELIQTGGASVVTVQQQNLSGNIIQAPPNEPGPFNPQFVMGPADQLLFISNVPASAANTSRVVASVSGRLWPFIGT